MPPSMLGIKCGSVVGAMVLPNVGGFANAHFFVNPNLKTWYQSLKKPSWTPPNKAFPFVWTGLYAGMGYASYIVYKHGGGFDGPARLPLMVYGGQLLLNWAWTPLFFGARRIKYAFYEILALDAAAAATAYLFYQVDHRAGLLLIPYLMWLSLATSLSYCIHRDNPDKDAGVQITEVKEN